MLSMRMIFTPEQQIFVIEPYFSNGHTLHTFRESDSVQQEVLDPKFVLRKILRLSNVEDEPQLSLRQLSQQTELSVSICQRIVRKDLEIQ
jgi:hypothetical protein